MATIVVNTEVTKDSKKISRHIYGQFAEHLGRCIYDGFYVGEDSSIPNTRGIRNDIVDTLKKIKIPNLRWPGGCFADEYHWKDGIGPKEKRPRTINTHWGGVIEDNSFGTHEFFDLCDQLECEPYICGNVGSGTVHEMAQWIEYINFDGKSSMVELRRDNGRQDPWKIKYWGVGNENWGCGGSMTPEYYSDLYCQYSTYCKNLSGNNLYRIACGPPGEYQIGDVLNWVDVLLKRTSFVSSFAPIIQGISLHYYTRAGFRKATEFKEKRWVLTMKKSLYIEDLLTNISEIMDKHDPNKKIGLIVDEWGTWWNVERGTNPGFLYQQNTMRDALVAALHLDIFNKHCDRVHMANIAQTINVLQAMILTKGEEMILTPTYHVFDLYQVHQDATLLPISIISEIYVEGKQNLYAIHGSASIDDNQKIHVSLCNIDHENAYDISIEFSQIELNDKKISARLLRGEKMNSHNTFDNPDQVKIKDFDSSNFKIEGKSLSFKMPSMSIIVIEL
jgi:alpha-N-arabinofuranosidase